MNFLLKVHDWNGLRNTALMPHCLYVFGCWLNRTHGSFLYFSLSFSLPPFLLPFITNILRAYWKPKQYLGKGSSRPRDRRRRALETIICMLREEWQEPSEVWRQERGDKWVADETGWWTRLGLWLALEASCRPTTVFGAEGWSDLTNISKRTLRERRTGEK